VRTMTHRVAVPLARQQLSRNQGRADCYARSRCPSLTSLSVSTTAPTFEANRAGATSRSVTNLTFALMESDTPQLSIVAPPRWLIRGRRIAGTDAQFIASSRACRTMTG